MSEKNLAENNLIRFISVTQKRDGLFVNFKVNGVHGGVVFSASLSVDATAAQVEMSDSLEQIIESCAFLAVKQIQGTDFQFRGID